MKTLLSLILTIFTVLIINAQELELPFFDDFEETISNDATFTNWTSENLEGWHYWHIIPWNGNPGQCMRIQNTDVAQNDWLISNKINAENIDNIMLSFDCFHTQQGVKPKLLYTTNYNGIADQCNWTEIQYTLGENENEWYYAGDIIIENPGNSIWFAFHYEADANKGIYFLLDNFKVKSYTPLNYSFSDSTEYFKFQTTLENGEDYWNEIAENLDNWYVELCSYWDRPGITPIFNPDEKTKIYLISPEYFAEQSDAELPNWKCGYTQNLNLIFTKLPDVGNSVYENSYSTLVKNTLGQFILSKHFGEHTENFFKEAFGLFYTGYQPKRDSILKAMAVLGKTPPIDALNNISNLANTYQKDLITSFIEAKVLSVGGVQNCYLGGMNEHWYSHLEYYYIKSDEERIKLLKQTERFNIYAANSDLPYINAISNKLDERINLYETLFDFPIKHRLYCVVYPTGQARGDCLIISSGSGGSGWSGDKMDITSKTSGWPDADYYGFLIPHELFHVFHFNIVKHLFTIPAIYSEGLASYISLYNNPGYLDGTEHNIYKIAYAFNHYQFNYNIVPNFKNMLNSEADDKFDGYYNEPYYFGELFYKYFMDNEGDFSDLRTFFLSNLDYSSIGKTYDEIDKGYMTFLKEYAGLNASIDTLELPFTDNFDDRFKNWSYVNVEGFKNYWLINSNNGFNQSTCANIGGNIPNEDWLISDIFNTKGYHNLRINFKYVFNGLNPEFYYATDFDGDISNTSWKKVENVLTGNQNVWNNATINIEDPGNSLVIGIRFKSANNNFVYLSIDNVSVDGIYTGTKTLQITDNKFKVYPNPVSGNSLISFQTKTNENVNISVYDIQGRKICTLLDEKMNAGTHTIQLGNQIQPNGIYLCKLTTSEGVSSLKLVVNK